MSWEESKSPFPKLPAGPRRHEGTRCQNVLPDGRCEERAYVVYERLNDGSVISLCAQCHKALAHAVRLLYKI